MCKERQIPVPYDYDDDDNETDDENDDDGDDAEGHLHAGYGGAAHGNIIWHIVQTAVYWHPFLIIQLEQR